MVRSRRIAIAVVWAVMFAVAGLSVGVYAGDDDNLSGAEIEAILSGNSVKGRGFTLYYDPSGEVRGIEGGERDSGRWWTEEDRFCFQWQNWVGGEAVCMHLWKTRKGLRRERVDGKYKDKVKVKEGNVKNL